MIIRNSSPPPSLICYAVLYFCREEHVFVRLFSGVYVSRRHIPPDEINYYRHSGKSKGNNKGGLWGVEGKQFFGYS